MATPVNTRTSRGAILVIALLVSLAPSLSRAQSAEDIAAARALFEEGLRLADGGDLAGGEQRFRRSLALNPVPAVAFNLAFVLAQQGQSAEAADYYSQVASNPVAPTDLREQARQRGHELERRLARLRVGVTGSTSGLTLRIGRRELGLEAIGVPIRVDAGRFRVEALRVAEVVAAAEVALAAGTEGTIQLDVGAPGPPVWESWWLWTIVGAVVAGAAATAIGFALSGTDPSYVGNIGPGVVVVP